MSVAAGMAQPRSVSAIAPVDGDIDEGRHHHAAERRDARQDPVAARCESCPSSTSRLISRPTSRKNTAIRPSLIQCRTLERAEHEVEDAVE